MNGDPRVSSRLNEDPSVVRKAHNVVISDQIYVRRRLRQSGVGPEDSALNHAIVLRYRERQVESQDLSFVIVYWPGGRPEKIWRIRTLVCGKESEEGEGTQAVRSAVPRP